uniref:Cilia and flagella associated protein 20 n=1 Tax=Sinocyclocheilus rhinocerous TaxID=307959 RepID=A0A673G9V0_9TELE
MFKNTFQSGFLSILYSIGSKPLQIWDKKVRNGHIKRITDNDIQSLVLEVEGTNVSSGRELVLDDKNVRRRFRASNYQSTTRVKPFICTMPMRLDDGWNQIQFNLSDFTRRAYGTNYIETLRVQIHANCRIRRVYFSDRLYSEDELPAEFKLYLPVQNKAKVSFIMPAHVQNHILTSLCINLVYFLHSSDTADGIPSFPLFVLSAHVHIGWISSGTVFLLFFGSM